MENESHENQPTAQPVTECAAESDLPVAKVNYKITERDFMDQTDFIIAKTVSRMKLKSRIMLSVSVVLVVLLLAVTDWNRYLLLIIFLLLLSALLLVLNIIFALILRLANKNAAKARREAGEFDLPMEADFYPDRLTILGALTHSVFQWNEITNAFETADGLYLVHQEYRYLFMPVRFFDRDSASSVTTFLQQTLGEKFKREAEMLTPESAENPGEAVQLVTDEGEPVYKFDFAMTGEDVTEVTGRRSKTILTVVGAVITVICGLWAYGSFRHGNTYYAVLAILVCIIMIAVFVWTYIRNVRAANYPTKNISLRWYEDHVSAVTYQDDEATNIVPYAKIKKIVRQGNLTIITFKDNTFLYVPQSSFEDEGERTKFEAFLNEKQIKNSK